MQKSVLFIQGGSTGAYAEDLHLANSLQRALGDDYNVLYPRMPDEENCPYPEWQAIIDRYVEDARTPIVLVGHSIGGSVLLKYLYDRTSPPRIAGLFAIAAPYWGAGEPWHWPEVTLPTDANEKLTGDWPLIFYQSRDDEVVPFAHVSLYAAKFPRATIREFDGGGHQFDNDLTAVATDIRALIR